MPNHAPDTNPPDVAPSDAGPLLAGLSAPLAAVSTRSGEVVNAQIAVAITAASIVLHRPRLIVQIYHTNYTHDLIASGGVLAVNFLNHDQLPLIWQLGMRSGRDGDKLNESLIQWAQPAAPCWKAALAISTAASSTPWTAAT